MQVSQIWSHRITSGFPDSLIHRDICLHWAINLQCLALFFHLFLHFLYMEIWSVLRHQLDITSWQFFFIPPVRIHQHLFMPDRSSGTCNIWMYDLLFSINCLYVVFIVFSCFTRLEHCRWQDYILHINTATIRCFFLGSYRLNQWLLNKYGRY